MTKTTIGIGAVVLIVIAVWWFGRGAAVAPTSIEANQATNSEQSSVTTSDVTVTAQVTSEPLTIAIAGNEFSYTPSAIVAKVGQTVTVTYKNTGKYPHNFVIDELGFTSKTIKAGETDTFSFVPNKTGAFSFYCSLPNHREKGMVGTLSIN